MLVQQPPQHPPRRFFSGDLLKCFFFAADLVGEFRASLSLEPGGPPGGLAPGFVAPEAAPVIPAMPDMEAPGAMEVPGAMELIVPMEVPMAFKSIVPKLSRVPTPGNP